jgi:hypothetical protein
MKKSEVFETTYRQYLQQIAEIDLVSRAAILGAEVVDEALEIPFYGKPHRVSKTGVRTATGQRASFLFRQSAEKHIDMECLAIGGTYLTGCLIREAV